MFAVTGSTGHLGRLAIAALKQRLPAAEIVAIARDAGRAADLGVAVRTADYADREGYTEALRGVDRLLMISSSAVGHRAEHHANVIAAAKAAGVGFIAYTSLINVGTSEISLAAEHRDTEAELAASGIAHANLRNGWYTENYEQTIAQALASGRIIGSSGEGRISAASRSDYAEAAAIVIAGEGHAGRTYELGGDTAFTLAELAGEIGRIAGRPVAYDNLSQSAHIAALVAAGLPEGVAQMLAGWDAGIAKGALEDNSHTLSKLLGRPTRPIAELIAGMARKAA